MLSSFDQHVAERDAKLPGLAVLLDNAAMSDVLHTYLPELGVADVRCYYVRYKPGSKCLAAFCACTATEEIDLYVKAYPAGQFSRSEQSSATPRKRKVSDFPVCIRPRMLIVPEASLSIHLFPFDKKIPALPRLADQRHQSEVLERILANGQSELAARAPELSLRRLAYKPERRFVAAICDDRGPLAVLKLHSQSSFERLSCNARKMGGRGSAGVLRTPRRLGRSRRYSAIVMEWLEGALLDEVAGSSEFDPGEVRRVGAALAKLHRRHAERLSAPGVMSQVAAVRQVAAAVGQVAPECVQSMRNVAVEVASRLAEQPAGTCVIHGDFYTKQVVMGEQTVGFIDLDEIVLGNAAADLGNFIAHLEWDVIRRKLSRQRAEAMRQALLDGYAGSKSVPTDHSLAIHFAAGLLRLAPHPFRNREPEWPRQIESLVARAEAALDPARQFSTSLHLG